MATKQPDPSEEMATASRLITYRDDLEAAMFMTLRELATGRRPTAARRKKLEGDLAAQEIRRKAIENDLDALVKKSGGK